MRVDQEVGILLGQVVPNTGDQSEWPCSTSSVGDCANDIIVDGELMIS